MVFFRPGKEAVFLNFFYQATAAFALAVCDTASTRSVLNIRAHNSDWVKLSISSSSIAKEKFSFLEESWIKLSFSR